MSKQVLIYENVVAVDKEKHKTTSIKSSGDYSFSSDLNSVPLLVTEFVEATKELTVVFSGEGEDVMPVAILGVENNACLSPGGDWEKSYIPAFFRRYPFIFASDDEGENFTLCLDESYQGCNEENIGERLFDAEGSQTVYLKGVLEFLQTYQAHFKATQVFCQKLVELDLLEPMEATYSIKDKKTGSLSGFQAVSREKIKALPDDVLLDLVRSDHLELLYKHLNSLGNFNLLVEKIGETLADADEEKDEKDEKDVEKIAA